MKLITLAPAFALTLACASSPPPAPHPAPAPPPAPSPHPAPAPAPAGPLILDGTPEIPAELKANLRRYLEARSASVTSVSDDGRSLLVVTRFGTTDQIHRVTTPGGARTQLTFEAEPVRNAEFVPGGGGAFLFIRDQGGDENYQLFRAAPDGRITRLTDGRSRHGGLAVARDGRHVAYYSNARNGKDMDIWLGDGADPASARLCVEASGHYTPLEFSPDARLLLVQEYLSIAESRLHLVDVQTCTARALTTDKAAYRDATFSGDGKAVIVTTDKGGDFVALMRLALDSGATTPLGPPPTWNVEAIARSGDGRLLATVTNEDGLSVLRILDGRTGKELARPAVPRGVIRGLSFAANAPVVAFSLSGSTSNGDAFSYDHRQRSVTRWTSSEVGGLDASRFVEPELVRYPSFDGRQIPAFVYRPPGDGPFPVVINIHGGPESQARPNFSPLLQYLVSESKIAVLVPNVRGSDGYGKAYLALDDGRLREGSVKDIGALVDWIGTRKDLDASKVAVMGGSYGGYMVLASLVHFGERIVAGIDMVGISSFVTFLENTAAYRRELRRREYGDESDPAMREFLTAISPLTHVDEIRSALFVAHGANDPRVPLSEAEQIVEAVRKSGREAWKLVAMNEGHGFSKRENRDAFSELVVLFLERHLGPR